MLNTFSIWNSELIYERLSVFMENYAYLQVNKWSWTKCCTHQIFNWNFLITNKGVTQSVHFLELPCIFEVALTCTTCIFGMRQNVILRVKHYNIQPAFLERIMVYTNTQNLFFSLILWSQSLWCWTAGKGLFRDCVSLILRLLEIYLPLSSLPEYDIKPEPAH